MPVYFDKKNNTYYVKVFINGRQLLKRKYQDLPIFNKDVALKCEKELLIEYSTSDNIFIPDLFCIFENYLYKKYKETSAKRYYSLFKLYIRTYFINKFVSNITSSYLMQINDSINELSYKRIKDIIFLLKVFLKFLKTYNLNYSESLLFEFKKSAPNNKKYNIYTKTQFDLLISVIDDLRYVLLFSLLFYYGLRIGELRGLTVSDVTSGRVSINKELSNKGRYGSQKLFSCKTNSSIREYPYVANLEYLINTYVSINGLKVNDYLFKSNNCVIGETTIRNHLIKYCNVAHLPVIKLHEFRHSCASYLINNGIDPLDIASWLGHSDVTTTLRVYSHLLPLRKQNVANLLNKK